MVASECTNHCRVAAEKKLLMSRSILVLPAGANEWSIGVAVRRNFKISSKTLTICKCLEKAKCYRFYPSNFKKPENLFEWH